MNNKVLFLDSEFGKRNIIKKRNQVPKKECEKVNKIIDYQIKRLWNSMTDYDEWKSMYNLVYSFIPYQLYLNRLSDLAILLYGVIVQLETYEEEMAYKEESQKLYNDLVFSKIMEPKKQKCR